MAMARSRRVLNRVDYWPSFVDVLTNLLLVFIFLLSIFAVVQFLLSRELSGKDTVLDKLNAQIDDLTQMLALERASNSDLNNNVATLQASLTSTQGQRDQLQTQLAAQSSASDSASQQIASLNGDLT